MDYILVPSLYEGGPMSAIEALACGTPIIAPDVGWIPDYPHIPFATGSSTDLRRVLTNLVAAKVAARLPVLGQTWDRFANEHDTAF
ncbi:glycosyltransferase, partial [Enterococcus faecium]|uniref:glycosyltransferase n=1 Tax=Enterococcus faecium TaxID=1352 RepID=UPI003F42BA71